MLQALPDEGDKSAWLRLREKDQAFLLSLRGQFERRGTITEAQYIWLEDIYERVG